MRFNGWGLGMTLTTISVVCAASLFCGCGNVVASDWSWIRKNSCNREAFFRFQRDLGPANRVNRLREFLQRCQPEEQVALFLGVLVPPDAPHKSGEASIVVGSDCDVAQAIVDRLHEPDLDQALSLLGWLYFLRMHRGCGIEVSAVKDQLVWVERHDESRSLVDEFLGCIEHRRRCFERDVKDRVVQPPGSRTEKGDYAPLNADQLR